MASWTDSSGVGHLRQKRQILGDQRNRWVMPSGLPGSGGVMAVGARGGSVVTWRRQHCECHGGGVLRFMRPLGVSDGVPVGFPRCVLFGGGASLVRLL